MTDDPLSSTFAALADPTRRAILARLAEGEATVNELAEPFPISLQAMSKHLKVLERAGLITPGHATPGGPAGLEAAPLETASDRRSRRAAGSGAIASIASTGTCSTSNEPNQPSRHQPTDDKERTMTDSPTTDAPTAADALLGDVIIVRDFDAPRELVFKAFFDPEQLAQFWGPEGTHTPVETIVIEPHAGGRFETEMVADDGSGSYPNKGIFTEIDEPNRLGFREPESGVVTTSTFTDLGDGRTRITIHQTGVPAMYRSPEALAGFLTSLDRLERYAASTAPLSGSCRAIAIPEGIASWARWVIASSWAIPPGVALRPRSAGGFGPAVVVVEPLDVVLAERRPVLHLDEDELGLAVVLDAMGGADGHVDGHARSDGVPDAVERHRAGSGDHEPVL